MTAATSSVDTLLLAQQLRLSIDLLRRTVRNRRSLEGIPRAQEAALSWLRRKGPLSIADLARWEQVRPQTMGVVVASLVHAGLVEKTPDPDDGRRDVVVLTAAGQHALLAIAEQRDRDLAQLVSSRLSAGEQQLLADAFGLLDRLTGDSE